MSAASNTWSAALVVCRPATPAITMTPAEAKTIGVVDRGRPPPGVSSTLVAVVAVVGLLGVLLVLRAEQIILRLAWT